MTDLQAIADEGRNLVPDATDDQAHLIEAFAADLEADVSKLLAVVEAAKAAVADDGRIDDFKHRMNALHASLEPFRDTEGR